VRTAVLVSVDISNSGEPRAWGELQRKENEQHGTSGPSRPSITPSRTGIGRCSRTGRTRILRPGREGGWWSLDPSCAEARERLDGTDSCACEEFW